MTDRRQALEPGTSIGAYRIESLIGAGGMGARGHGDRAERVEPSRAGFKSRWITVPWNSSTPESDAGSSHPLFPSAAYAVRVWRDFDISKDGQRFLMVKPLSAPEAATRPPEIVVVENWFEEPKRLVPVH